MNEARLHHVYMTKLLIEPNTGHWFWLSVITSWGYGRFWDGTRYVMAHRWLYEQLVEPIPDGMFLDHVCRVRHCVNPNHLRVVTPLQNVHENNVGPVAQNLTKTHCAHGHPFSAENTWYQGRKRRCRACGMRHQRERRQRRQDERAV